MTVKTPLFKRTAKEETARSFGLIPNSAYEGDLNLPHASSQLSEARQKLDRKLSYERRQELLRKEVTKFCEANLKENTGSGIAGSAVDSYYPNFKETYDDRVIFEAKSKIWSLPYKLQGTDVIFGNLTEVKQNWVPVI